ncbi:hypothetical protein [Ottowia sp.]|uniref:hypothetical protein n=1 Tax=Ottowia sp. TaxID=1898956 RepID=UPI0039E330E9
MNLTSDASAWQAAIAWGYLLSNAARVFTYLPQIVVVWRCRDGARAVSLLTWGSWVAANSMAVLYGALVVSDLFFLLISLVNLAGCGLVAGIAARRRWQWRCRQRGPGPALEEAASEPAGAPLTNKTIAPGACLASAESLFAEETA